MSNMQEERGNILLPSAAVIPTRNALTRVSNERRAYVLEVAGKVHAHFRSEAGKEHRKALSAMMRGKRVDGYYGLDDLISEVVKKLYPNRETRGWGGGYSYTESSMKFEVDSYEIEDLIITRRTNDGEPRRLQAPKKKDLPPLLESKTWNWSGDYDELFISIDPKTRRLTWSISENNHSVDRAHESYLGRALFGALNKINWTRGTGGVSYYSDEYMKESLIDGGDGASESYYGPLGEKAREDKLGWRPQRKSSMRR